MNQRHRQITFFCLKFSSLEESNWENNPSTVFCPAGGCGLVFIQLIAVNFSPFFAPDLKLFRTIQKSENDQIKSDEYISIIFESLVNG